MSSITSSLNRSFLVSAIVLSGLMPLTISHSAIASISLSEYDAAITTKSITADDFYSRGVYFHGKGQFETALDQFNQAIALNASNPDYHFSRGLTYADIGDHQAARRDYSTALAIDPSFAAAYYQRGLSQIVIPVAGVSNLQQPAIDSDHHTDVHQAIRDFSMALKHSPDFVAAHYYRGLSHYVLGNEILATADYHKARRINPQIAESFYREGFTQWSIGGPQTY